MTYRAQRRRGDKINREGSGKVVEQRKSREVKNRK